MHVVTGEEMRLIDRYTMDEIGLSEETLMENAGQAVGRALIKKLTEYDTILVLIGAGNNGGDGFVISRILQEKGYQVRTWVIPPEGRIKGTAAVHKHIYENCGYSYELFAENEQRFQQAVSTSGIIVDALLGTGATGALRSPYDSIVKKVNEADATVFSIDIPSGLPSAEGEEFSNAVKASETMTLQAPKLTAFIYPEAQYFGRITTVDMGIPAKAVSVKGPSRFLITEEQVRASLPERKANAHKGSSGKALIVGGCETMTGAPVLSANACLRSGAGLVTTAVPEGIKNVVAGRTTESTFQVLKQEQGEIPGGALKDLSLDAFDGIAIGPGMGRKHNIPLHDTLAPYPGVAVIDADGLFHLANERHKWRAEPRRAPTVITPHPGEMAAIAGLTVKEVEQSRFALTKQIAADYQMYVVLKGPHTVVACPDGRQWINSTGNAALAKGGTGDVLTGIVLGLLLQNESPADALCQAVFVHGRTADELIQTKDIFSVTASDLIHRLPEVLHSLRY